MRMSGYTVHEAGGTVTVEFTAGTQRAAVE